MHAVVEWLSKAQGGRIKPPPGVGGPPYSPVIRFIDEPWPAPLAWSVSVEKVEAFSDEYAWLADIQFRFDEAPPNSLRAGRKFELYEGPRLVARGRFTKDAANSPRKRDFGMMSNP